MELSASHRKCITFLLRTKLNTHQLGRISPKVFNIQARRGFSHSWSGEVSDGISLMGGLAMLFHMELSPDPACAQANDAVIYIPEAATLWLASATAPRTPGRRLDNQDLSLRTTGGTGPLIRSESLAIAACAIFRG